MVGQFKWDLTGPSYLLPVRRPGITNGFVVADVTAEERLSEHEIRYFIRKVKMYQNTSNSGVLFPILMARGFSGEALTQGHKAGLMLTTPRTLFGKGVSDALEELTKTLTRAAAIAAVDGDRLHYLLNHLTEIEGRAGNMRGILFELMVAHVAKRHFGGSVDVGKSHTHRQDGRSVDLDVICVTGQSSVHLIECKGKAPGGVVSKEEVAEWIRKLPLMQDYVVSREHLRERHQTYEFWTTGSFASDALGLLEVECSRRTKRPIFWKDGTAVRKKASELRLKSIGDALDQHFVKHPLAQATSS